MLATVLKSKVATQVSIRIMDAFVSMRKFINENKDMLIYKKDNVSVELITSSHYLTKLDINKFNKQYPNLNIKYSNIFPDRFIIIDNTLYHLGASLKDLGKKYFAINKIEDKEILQKIIEKI